LVEQRGFKLTKNKDEEFVLDDDEIVVGINAGRDKDGNVKKFSFAISKI